MKTSLYQPYEVKNGAIYNDGEMIDNLGFLLSVDRDTKVATLSKHGKREWMDEHMNRLLPLSEFIIPCVFSFGENYESVYSKEEQVAIIAYMVNYSLSKITSNLALRILAEDYVGVKGSDSMIALMKRNGDFA